MESLGQADLRAQFSAPIAQINAKLGDSVSAGQTLVQLKNDDINAQLEQAQAALAAAQSRLAELKRGNRAEDIAISQTAADETQAALVNSIKDAYVKSDDAIHNHIDKFFANPRQSNAKFSIIADTASGQITIQASDAELGGIAGNKKYAVEIMLAGWKTATNSLDAKTQTDGIESALALSKTNLQKEIDFLNEMAPIVNDLSSENATYKQIIDGYKTEFSAARTAINGALASLQAAETAWKTAGKTLELKLAGSSQEQISQGQAAVDQAQASVNAIKAALAKTSVVSPINGKISFISGNIGEFVSAGTLVASVINPEVLQVKSYISENDLQFVSENDPAIIKGSAAGIVQTISPAIDPQTRKAEINILITKNSEPPVLVGQSVGAEIAAAKLQKNGDIYLLPIEMIQFSGNGNYVFTAENGAIKQIPVATGEIVGENIYVTGGLSAGMEIVSSVRGLKDGDSIIAQ